MMLSRALSLATVTLLIGCCAMGQVKAQENLEAGKSPSQIFAGTCTACHKGPRGLLKTVPAGSLASFLRQHYTTSPEMAGVLASYLVSNGATDTRYGGGQPPKGAKEAKSEAKPEPKSEARSEPKSTGPGDLLERLGRKLRAEPEVGARQASRGEPEAPGALGEPTRPGRNAKKLAKPAEAPEAVKPTAEGQVPAEAAAERGPDGRKLSAKQRLGRRGKPGFEEAPKVEPTTLEPGKPEPVKDEASVEPAKGEINGEGAKVDGSKPETAKPAEVPSQSANADPAKDASAPVLRPDPVPPVTPAPPSATLLSATPATAIVAPAAAPDTGGAEPAAASAAPAPADSAPPAPTVTASAPPLPLVVPAGPPAPPISQ